MSDIAKSENCAFLFSFDHRVHFSFLDDIGANNFSACASEDSGQKSANFDDSITDNGSLKLNIAVEFFLSDAFRIFGHNHKFLHHAFDRLNEQGVNISGEKLHEDEQSDAGEQSLYDVEKAHLEVVLALVQDHVQSCKVDVAARLPQRQVLPLSQYLTRINGLRRRQQVLAPQNAQIDPVEQWKLIEGRCELDNVVALGRKIIDFGVDELVDGGSGDYAGVGVEENSLFVEEVVPGVLGVAVEVVAEQGNHEHPNQHYDYDLLE